MQRRCVPQLGNSLYISSLWEPADCMSEKVIDIHMDRHTFDSKVTIKRVTSENLLESFSEGFSPSLRKNIFAAESASTELLQLQMTVGQVETLNKPPVMGKYRRLLQKVHQKATTLDMQKRK
ncbi:hypothetical protein T265_05805 [Opisthorchis viverrini]|uniref:Uncharacterized protein n=1 Tax=Opisthorchis viverrini TaxID=6198 RepID=A0A074ZJF2_OPIVI|nr:hypothetical protein T265_05805 [Opisthorchis viverrini]KER27116.1 hypothetical protein T265_05805 [Opisthorchis viverrini]